MDPVAVVVFCLVFVGAPIVALLWWRLADRWAGSERPQRPAPKNTPPRRIIHLPPSDPR